MKLIVTLLLSSYLSIGHCANFDYHTTPWPEFLIKLEQFHLQHALSQREKQQDNLAWGNFSYLLARVPNHPIALKNQQELALKLGKSSEMQVYFDRALTISPKDSFLYVLYSHFLYSIGNKNSAEQHWKTALSLDPALPAQLLATNTQVAFDARR